MGKAAAVQSGRALPMSRCASPPWNRTEQIELENGWSRFFNEKIVEIIGGITFVCVLYVLQYVGFNVCYFFL